MGKAQEGATGTPTEKTARIGALGPHLDRPAADGKRAEPIRVHHLLVDGDLYYSPRPREAAVAFPGRQLGRTANGNDRWSGTAGPLLPNAPGDLTNRLRRILGTRIPALPPWRGGTIRTGTQISDRASASQQALVYFAVQNRAL